MFYRAFRSSYLHGGGVRCAFRCSSFLYSLVTFVHACRKTTYAGKYKGYFSFALLKLYTHFSIYDIFILRMCYMYS
jgi:hypothetical protein